MEIDYATLPDAALNRLIDEACAEKQRRMDLTRGITAAPELQEAYLGSLGREPGGPWSQPLGSFDAYPEGWVVTHNGKEWVSLVAGNVWEPGVSGWRENLPEGEYPAWVQPTGGHDAYGLGEIVTHEGHLWESLHKANVWPPGTEGLWKDLGPVAP